MIRFLVTTVLLVTAGIGVIIFTIANLSSTKTAVEKVQQVIAPNPLSIQALKDGRYPGSDLKIEQTLTPGSNYQRYIASYQSEGLTQYGLLTIPDGAVPSGGFPAIIFNHGFIPPKEYVTTERYIAYTDAFSRAGYVLFKPDYRGNGNSEGQAVGAYGSNSYTIDVLNAMASVEKLKEVNPQKIGMWGHSMGGFITLRSLVASPDIKVAVIWGGVVGSYTDMLYNWHRTDRPAAYPTDPAGPGWRSVYIQKYGDPKTNPEFWNALSATSYLSDISAPLQLDHAESDEEVPVQFSKDLYAKMKALGKTVELYTYPGDDHNISGNLTLALQRSVDFFDKYLK
jgi:dipeptidyl aminopeptidase/acylaminoacyl peptidase